MLILTLHSLPEPLLANALDNRVPLNAITLGVRSSHLDSRAARSDERVVLDEVLFGRDAEFRSNKSSNDEACRGERHEGGRRPEALGRKIGETDDLRQAADLLPDVRSEAFALLGGDGCQVLFPQNRIAFAQFLD